MVRYRRVFAGSRVGAPLDEERIERHVWWIGGVVMLGSVMSILDTTIVNVALATLGHDLHASVSEVQWVVTGYMLALAAVIPVSGWAGERFGVKRVYLASLVLFTVGSVLCGLSTSLTELVAFRVLQGVGGGMILPLGQMMVAGAAGPKRMGRVMSIIVLPAMLAPILGPTLGGFLIQGLSWRWIFYVNVPVGIAAVVAGSRILPAARVTKPRALDVRGLLLMATGLPLLTYGLAEIGTTGTLTSTEVLVPCIGGLLLIALFVLHALRVPAPLLNLRLHRRRTFSSASAAMFLLGTSLFGGMILMPLYWQEIRHESVIVTGLLLAPAFMPAMTAAFAALRRSELADATPQLNVLQRV